MIVYDSCPVCGSKNILPVLSVKDFTVSGEIFEVWECKSCTLRFTQNIPEFEEMTPYYKSENYISHSETKAGIINRLYHQVRKRTLRKKRRLIEGFTGMRSGNILDIGSGTGAFLSEMKKKWKVTGLEPEESARQKASELYGLEVAESSALFSMKTGTFDAITMWHVLEHVHDMHSYISQIKALLKPGGKLFIAVPNYTSYDEEVYHKYWAAYDVPRHLYHFSPFSMKELLSLHGLKIISEKPMWYDSVYVSMLSEKYKTGTEKPLSAFFTGMLSNSKALFDTKKCSSVIYISQAEK